MNILFNEKVEKTEQYRYRINQGGEINLRVSNGSERDILIIFVNGKFYKVVHSLKGFDERSDWYVYGAIAEKIKEIEETTKQHKEQEK